MTKIKNIRRFAMITTTAVLAILITFGLNTAGLNIYEIINHAIYAVMAISLVMVVALFGLLAINHNKLEKKA